MWVFPPKPQYKTLYPRSLSIEEEKQKNFLIFNQTIGSVPDTKQNELIIFFFLIEHYRSKSKRVFLFIDTENFLVYSKIPSSIPSVSIHPFGKLSFTLFTLLIYDSISISVFPELKVQNVKNRLPQNYIREYSVIVPRHFIR